MGQQDDRALMHPAFSVIFFTVTSGLGYGLLFCLLVARLINWPPFSDGAFYTGVGIATTLFTLGLLSSSLHLANPRNAWRSFVRFRTSWLSREAVLAVLGYPLFAVTLWSMHQFWPVQAQHALTMVSLVWIVALIYCTAMIYASLKTIPQWNTAWVPAGFLMLALLSGLLCFTALAIQQISSLRPIVLVVLFLAAVVKTFYFRHIGQPTRSSINTATSFSKAQVTLFDAGHSSRNFSQREFIYEVGPKTTQLARILVMILTFVTPALLLGFFDSIAAVVVAIFGAYAGLLLERWLFFVEAKHVVRHYYGH